LKKKRKEKEKEKEKKKKKKKKRKRKRNRNKIKCINRKSIYTFILFFLFYLLEKKRERYFLTKHECSYFLVALGLFLEDDSVASI